MDDSLASSIFHFSAVHFDVVDGANVYPEDFPPTASPAPSASFWMEGDLSWNRFKPIFFADIV